MTVERRRGPSRGAGRPRSRSGPRKPSALDRHLRHGEDTGEGLRRILGRELERALDLAGGRVASPRSDRDEIVHEARKSLKRMRAVLRLARSSLGRAAYRKENRALRDAARPLAEARDARVLVDTIAGLARLAGGTEEAQARSGLIRSAQLLTESYLAITARVSATDHVLVALTEALGAARARVEAWRPAPGQGFPLLERGLARTYRRALRTRAAVLRGPTSRRFHEWRKEVKYFLAQLRLLEPGWGASERLLAGRLDRLATVLGEDHDLAELRGRVKESDVRRLAARRREILQREALATGRLVFEVGPATRMAALRRAWSRWQA